MSTQAVAAREVFNAMHASQPDEVVSCSTA